MILSINELRSQGLAVHDATDPERYGYPGGLDIFDCLWFELVNTARLGVNWRCDRPVETRVNRRLRELRIA